MMQSNESPNYSAQIAFYVVVCIAGAVFLLWMGGAPQRAEGRASMACITEVSAIADVEQMAVVPESATVMPQGHIIEGRVVLDDSTLRPWTCISSEADTTASIS